MNTFTPTVVHKGGKFTAETARDAGLRSAQAKREGRAKRNMRELSPEDARLEARKIMQGLLTHKDPKVRRDAAKYVLEEEKADREGARGMPKRIVYETRALPPRFAPRVVEGPPPAKPIATDDA